MTKNNIPNSQGCQYISPEQDPLVHWPVKYCGCQTVTGRSYCEEHLAVVYQKGTALRKRHKDVKRAETIWSWESLMNEAVEELESEGVDFS